MTGDDNDNVLTTDGGNDVIDGGAVMTHLMRVQVMII